ncbi:MAG TPA: hypothetical protein ENG51_15565 [Deltaproteobacteria bacterium]|nr:hypothetical protein [Deltaproteobacteria bacterium]HEC31292.1 hypothetical protein [Deltaproteobacteria bacterium]
MLFILEPKKAEKPITISPHQFLGYYNRPDDNSKRLYKSWFYAGYIATWDQDGFITIRGRTGDMILSGAEKVYPCAGRRIHNETSLGKRRVCDWETTSQLVFHPAVWRRFVVFILFYLRMSREKTCYLLYIKEVLI